MPVAGDDALVLFPGALGDFICFLPTLRGLRARHRGRLRVLAQPSLLALLRLPHTDTASIDRREVADLFTCASPPAEATVALLGGFGAVYAWTGAGDPLVARRLSAINAGPVSVHAFRGMRAGEHAVEYYARCAALEPETAIESIVADDCDWTSKWQREQRLDGHRLFVMHPGSGAPRKNWRGFDAVARCWSRQSDHTVVVLRGPAETGQSSVGHAHHGVLDARGRCAEPTLRNQDESSWGGGVLHVEGLALPQVAALLRRSALYLGNDSGVSHLAGALGARGVVLFGSTEPRTWAPRGGRLEVVHAPEPCETCGADVFCTHRLAIGRVMQALGQAPM